MRLAGHRHWIGLTLSVSLAGAACSRTETPKGDAGTAGLPQEPGPPSGAAAGTPRPGYYRYPTIHGDTIIFTSEGDLWE
ncbi:MAG: hypothetical protein ACLQVI_32725, partial [Polyangiaceae bacterium]